AATPTGGGYWEVASDGGIFSFGQAPFYGSMGGKPLNQPIVGMAATPTGGGYWEVASDGGIFSFGDARFYGSMGGKPLNQPIVGMTASPTGTGYIMVASDGGIFSFGHAPFFGSLGGVPISRPIVAMAMTPEGHGYWFTDNNGAVSAFGKAGYYGSAPQVLNQPVVGMAEAAGTGAFVAQAYPAGSYGYDVSVYQCNQLPPAPHVIGVVEVNGNGVRQTTPNPCLAQEASWAGAGLNLYDYLTFGTTATGPTVCGSPACNYGFHQAQNTYTMAKRVLGVHATVTWWLDVENTNYDWSSNAAQNAQVVRGALMGLRAKGINTVGIYASPGVWNSIVGTYQPPVPYWMAWYTNTTGGGGPYNCTHVTTWTVKKALPTGPVVMTQYADNVGYTPTPMHFSPGFDGDYAC
ncbi:MAG: glycoside hydrolase family 25 domain-containing protein, partial [Acidimicrobiales bacterium]